MIVPSLFFILCLAMLFPGVSFKSGGFQSQQAIVEKDPRKPVHAKEIEDLSFQELFESSTRELKPSTKLLSLDGKRVRMVGFMAQMETQPEGAFYLCPHPVFVDESGAGTGELPIGSVRVILSIGKDHKITHISRTIEVTGILEVGNRLEADGTVSSIRLRLDPSHSPKSKSADRQKKQPLKSKNHPRR